MEVYRLAALPQSKIVLVCLLLEGMHIVSSVRKEKLLRSELMFSNRTYYSLVNHEN